MRYPYIIGKRINVGPCGGIKVAAGNFTLLQNGRLYFAQGKFQIGKLKAGVSQEGATNSGDLKMKKKWVLGKFKKS